MDARNAALLLSSVQGEKSFYAADGTVLRSLEDLRELLRITGRSTFDHHVNEGRNDFVAWVRDVIGDNDLAASLATVHDRVTCYHLVNDRVKELKEALRPASKSPSAEAAPAPHAPEPAHSVHHEVSHHAHPAHHAAAAHPAQAEREYDRQAQREALIIKEFFYGMAAGVILALILVRILTLLH